MFVLTYPVLQGFLYLAASAVILLLTVISYLVNLLNIYEQEVKSLKEQQRLRESFSEVKEVKEVTEITDRTDRVILQQIEVDQLIDDLLIEIEESERILQDLNFNQGTAFKYSQIFLPTNEETAKVWYEVYRVSKQIERRVRVKLSLERIELQNLQIAKSKIDNELDKDSKRKTDNDLNED